MPTIIHITGNAKVVVKEPISGEMIKRARKRREMIRLTADGSLRVIYLNPEIIIVSEWVSPEDWAKIQEAEKAALEPRPGERRMVTPAPAIPRIKAH